MEGEVEELTDLLQVTNTKVSGDPMKINQEVKAEVVEVINFKVPADNNKVAANNMANNPIVDFEDEDGVG